MILSVHFRSSGTGLLTEVKHTISFSSFLFPSPLFLAATAPSSCLTVITTTCSCSISERWCRLVCLVEGKKEKKKSDCNVHVVFFRSTSVPAEEETPRLPGQEGKESRWQGSEREGQQQLPAAWETALPGGAEPRYNPSTHREPVMLGLVPISCNCSRLVGDIWAAGLKNALIIDSSSTIITPRVTKRWGDPPLPAKVSESHHGFQLFYGFRSCWLRVSSAWEDGDVYISLPLRSAAASIMHV